MGTLETPTRTNPIKKAHLEISALWLTQPNFALIIASLLTLQHCLARSWRVNVV